jgi:hypothetical protein
MVVIGFDPVIAISSSALPAAVQLTFALQFSNGSWIAAQTVPGKNVRRPIVRIAQPPLQEHLGGCAVTRFRKEGLKRLAAAVDCAEEVQPAEAQIPADTGYDHGGFELAVPDSVGRQDFLMPPCQI